MTKTTDCKIKQFNSIRNLTKEELHRISECKDETTFKKSVEIFNEGVSLKGVFLVKKGVVKLIKTSEDGKNQIVKLIIKGDLLGQRSLVSNEPTNLKAIALTEVKTCFIPKEEILTDLKNNPQFSFDVITKLANRLRESDNGLVNMAQKSIKRRLAEALLYIESCFGTTNEGYIALILSREDFANLVGTAKASIIRELSNFKDENSIALKGKQIKILDKKKLLASY